MAAKGKWKKLGVVGVDSGQLLICDPCYLDDANGSVGWEKNTDPEPHAFEPKNNAIDRTDFSYRGACAVSMMLSHENGDGQINYAMGHSGRAVVFNSGYGDGTYEVEGREIDDPDWGKRIVEVRIKMG